MCNASLWPTEPPKWCGKLVARLRRLRLGGKRFGAGASRVPFGAPTMAPPRGSTVGSAATSAMSSPSLWSSYQSRGGPTAGRPRRWGSEQRRAAPQRRSRGGRTRGATRPCLAPPPRSPQRRPPLPPRPRLQVGETAARAPGGAALAALPPLWEPPRPARPSPKSGQGGMTSSRRRRRAPRHPRS
eukprot:3697569-Pyramimonas_sp.AAC.1